MYEKSKLEIYICHLNHCNLTHILECALWGVLLVYGLDKVFTLSFF